MSNQKLNIAIMTIRKTCEDQKACVECPMNSNCGKCPKDWKRMEGGIPTFNRDELKKALDYWYTHLEAHNNEQNNAAWAAINAIKYCITYDSGDQNGGDKDV